MFSLYLKVHINLYLLFQISEPFPYALLLPPERFFSILQDRSHPHFAILPIRLSMKHNRTEDSHPYPQEESHAFPWRLQL